MSRDKDVRTCLHHVLAVIPHDHIHFVQVRRVCVYARFLSLLGFIGLFFFVFAQSKNFRAISREDLQQLFREETGGKEMSTVGGNGIMNIKIHDFNFNGNNVLLMQTSATP